MRDHLRAKHAGQFPESQLMTMVDICERPMDDDDDADCPICLATLSLSALRDHLARHLEELALFVLPCHMEDQSQDIGSDEAGGVTRQRLASNASSSEDGLPPLDFETTLPDTSYLQDPETFSTLLQSTVEIEQGAVENWFLANDQIEPQDDGDNTRVVVPLPKRSVYMTRSDSRLLVPVPHTDEGLRLLQQRKRDLEDKIESKRIKIEKNEGDSKKVKKIEGEIKQLTTKLEEAEERCEFCELELKGHKMIDIERKRYQELKAKYKP